MFQQTNPLTAAQQQLEGITKYWDDINKSIVDMTKNFGQTNNSLRVSGSYSNLVNKNFQSVGVRLATIGVEASKVSSFLSDMSDHTGTMVGFASEAMVKYGSLQKLLGDTNVDPMVKGLNDMGMGLSKSINYLDEMRQKNIKLGLNAKQVAKVMADNFKASAAVSYKGGIDQLSKMAKQSVIFGTNMQSVLDMADKLSSPEQAIEFTQNMQMLGGELANQFGDVTQIMYEARNEPEKLADRISKATASLMSFNKETGKMELLPENRAKAKMLAEQFSMSLDEVVKQGEKVKKLDLIKEAFGDGLSDEQRNVLTGFADFGAGGKISLEGLENLNSDELKKIGITQTDLADVTKLQAPQMAELIKVLQQTGESSTQTAEGQVKESVQLKEAISNNTTALYASADKANELSKTINSRGGARATIQGFSKDEGGKYMEELANAQSDLAGKMINDITGGFKKFFDSLNDQIQTRNSGGGGNNTSNVDCPNGDCPDSDKGDSTKCQLYNGKWCKKTAKKGKILSKGNIVTKTEIMGNGGVFNGPSHEDGGIPVVNKTDGSILEVEGGEAIINKKSTQMFKPLLSKINEVGGGIKFADGGITKSDLSDIMGKMESFNRSTNLNIGSNTPINVNVNVNGSISVDGKDLNLPDSEKEKLSKNIMKEVMVKVNSEIGQSTIFTGGKRKSSDNTFDF